MANKISLDDKTPLQEFGSTLYKGIMNGVSHIIPVIIIGGILLASVDVLGMEILGWDLRGSEEYMSENAFRMFLYMIRQVSFVALGLMLPVLGAYVAQGIGGKSALGPGFVGGMIAKGGAFGFLTIESSGFLGALFAGAVAGFSVLALKKIPFEKKYESLNSLFITPLLSALIVILPMLYFVGPSIAALNISITNGLQFMADNNLTIPLGMLIGAMACFDMGGPVNKIAYLFCMGLWADGYYMYYAAFTATKIIPGITIGLAALLFPKYFTQDERDGAIPSIILSSLGGIGEQAIPYALRDPISIIPAQMIGGAITGALILQFGIDINVGAGGSLITGFVTSNPLLWFSFFGIGAVVAFVIMVFMKKRKGEVN